MYIIYSVLPNGSLFDECMSYELVDCFDYIPKLNRWVIYNERTNEKVLEGVN